MQIPLAEAIILARGIAYGIRRSMGCSRLVKMAASVPKYLSQPDHSRQRGSGRSHTSMDCLVGKSD